MINQSTHPRSREAVAALLVSTTCSTGTGPRLAGADGSHIVAVLAVATMNGLFLTGLTYRVITKRFAVAWDTGAIAAVYAVAVSLAYLIGG